MTMDSRSAEGLAVADVGAALRRRAGIVAAFVAVGVVAGAAVWAWSVPTYSASATVTLRPITSDPFAVNRRPSDLVSPMTEAQLLRSTAVANEVRDRLGLGRSTAELLDAVTVTSPENTLALTVAASDREPQVAQRLADAFAAVYLDRRQADARSGVDRQLASLDERLVAQRRALTTAVQREQAAPPTSPERAAAAADADAARSRITSLEEARTATASVDTAPGQVAVAAARPTSPSGAPRPVTALGVVAAFALLGAAVALLRDRFDPRVRDARELRELVPGVPVDVLPVGAGPAAAQRRDLMARLAVRVGAAGSGAPARVLLAGVGEVAPGPVAVELADTLATAGRRTLVVWTGRPGACPGATDVVADGLGPVLRSLTPLSGVLPDAPEWVTWLSSAGGDDLSALLRPDAVDLFVEQASRCGFDVVLFATPSPVAQAVALGVAHGATAVVVAAGSQPQRRAVRDTVDLLAQVGVRPQEVVVG